MRGFLDLIGFYHRFIKGYATLAAPLTTLLTKDHFQWTSEADQAFSKLKEALCQAPVLGSPNFDSLFVVETNASGIGMGAILSQHHHPFAFFSKPFCSKLLRASTYMRELAAITMAVKKWWQYLLGHRFVILTDHRSLKELMAQAVQTLEQQVYLARLMGYDYTIHYRVGKANMAADALSRLPDPPQGQFFVLTIPNCMFLQELKIELSSNQEFVTRRQQIKDEPHNHLDCVLRDDLILQQGHIWLPRQIQLLPTILLNSIPLPPAAT